jgi:hypothetical protein
VYAAPSLAPSLGTGAEEAKMHAWTTHGILALRYAHLGSESNGGNASETSDAHVQRVGRAISGLEFRPCAGTAA